MVVQVRRWLLALAFGLLAGNAAAETRVLRSVPDIRELPRIEEAFRMIESQDATNVARLITMTEIPAPPFEEAVRAADFLSRLQAAGLSEASIDAVGNVVAWRRGSASRQTVALVAHLDTVFPREMDIKVRREGNTLFAPGIADNTRGLVLLLSLAEVLIEQQLETRDDLLFVGSVGEEGLGDLRGVRHLLSEEGIAVDQFIAVDGGDLNRLVVDGVGSNRYRVEFKGPGGHSYGAFGRAHPHQALADAIAQFTRRAQRITRRGPKATFSVGRIGGGTSINSIPFGSWMEVDMRSTAPEKVAALDTALREAVADALQAENRRRARGPELTVDVVAVGARPAGIGDRSDALLNHAQAAVVALGGTPELRASSTDANIAIARGIPAVTIARGGVSRNSHSPDESWENVESHRAIQAALLLVLATAGLVVAQ